MRLLAAACLGALLLIAASACGGRSESGSKATATVEADVAGVADSPTPQATATPPAAPVELGYRLTRTLPEATFGSMLGFAVIPGTEEAVVLRQRGEMWRISLDGDGGDTPALFGDISDLLKSRPSFEEGLLGLAFSPEFETDGRVFIHYTADEPRRSVISRFAVVGGALVLSGEHIVLEVAQPEANHNGGQLAFGPDGYLYIALGDGGGHGDPHENAQDLSTLHGSILRLDVSGDVYAIPPDNPFVDTPGARPEIYAYGFRNPWRFSFDEETGDLWAGDVGQDRWEEVDRVVAGGNYGWKIVEGDECFQADECAQEGLIPPRAKYTHYEGLAVIGGFVYRGAAMPELDGWYVYADFRTGTIWGLNTEDDSPPLVLAKTDDTISSLGVLPNGELIIVTFAEAIFQLERET